MGIITIEIFIIIILIIINGVLAMSEIAVVSARKVRLQQRAEGGDAGAGVALELANAPSRFLSTIQIGITLVGIFAGAIGGATIAAELDAWLEQIPSLAPYSEAIALGAIVVVITYLSLIVGELVPKRLALNNPEGIAARIARPMRSLSVIASPIVRLLSFSTESVLRLFGMRQSMGCCRWMSSNSFSASSISPARSAAIIKPWRASSCSGSGGFPPRVNTLNGAGCALK